MLINIPLKSLSSIKLSDYRAWRGRKHFDKNRYKELFEQYTKKRPAYRIYLPVGERYVPSVSPLPEIAEHLSKKGYVIEDYMAGYVSTKDRKQPIKLGKVLKEAPVLLDKYQKHKAKLGSKDVSNLMVVISRHPYDIAGMSTDRGWTSCTNLGFSGDKKGSRSIYVIDDVKEGNIIAYLVDKNDPNIEHPIARMRILRFVRVDGKDFYLKAHERVYGTDTPVFRKTVNAWLDEVNTEKSTDEYCATDLEVPDSEGLFGDSKRREFIFTKRKEVEAELMSDKLDARSITRKIAALRSHFVTETLVNFVLKSNYPYSVKQAALFSQATTMDTLKMVLQLDSDTDYKIKGKLFSLDRFDLRDLIYVGLKDKDSDVRVRAVACKQVTREHLEVAKLDSDMHVRLAVVTSPKADLELLSYFSRDRDIIVRQAADWAAATKRTRSSP